MTKNYSYFQSGSFFESPVEEGLYGFSCGDRTDPSGSAAGSSFFLFQLWRWFNGRGRFHDHWIVIKWSEENPFSFFQPDIFGRVSNLKQEERNEMIDVHFFDES